MSPPPLPPLLTPPHLARATCDREKNNTTPHGSENLLHPSFFLTHQTNRHRHHHTLASSLLSRRHTDTTAICHTHIMQLQRCTLHQAAGKRSAACTRSMRCHRVVVAAIAAPEGAEGLGHTHACVCCCCCCRRRRWWSPACLAAGQLLTPPVMASVLLVMCRC